MLERLHVLKFISICLFLHIPCIMKYSNIELHINFIKYNLRLLLKKIENLRIKINI